MVRRTTRTLALVATLLLVFPAAAIAYNLEVRGTISANSETVDIRVGFAADEAQPQRLRVRVAGEDRDRVVAECTTNCGTQPTGGNSIFRLPIRARGGAFGDLTNRYPNGPVSLDIQGERERLGQTDRFAIGRADVVLDVPGSAVGSLSASASGDEVRLDWSPAPEAGISGYRVERVRGGDATQVTTTSSTSATDRPGPGEHEYRVVTVRPKAGDGSHETVSSAVTAVVERPEEPSSGNGGNGGSNGGGSHGGDSSDGGSSSNGGSSSDGSSDDGSSSSSSRASAPEGDRSDADGRADREDEAEAPRSARDRGGVRTGQAPSVSRDRGGFGTPELPRVGDIFRGELDFDGNGDGNGGDGDPDDEVVLSAPGGGFGSFLGSGEEAERIAVPIAGGLLLTAIGLHLWRWLKVPLT